MTEQRQFEVICTTAQLFITTYDKNHWLPAWLFRLWHKPSRQAASIDQSIQSLKISIAPNDNLKDSVNKLLSLLLNHYYFLFVHTENKLLRGQVEDTILMCLTFNEADIPVYENLINIKNDIKAYYQYFQQKQELQTYRNYFAKKHAIYGVPAYQLGENELTQLAKAGLVNGKLIERFGMMKIVVDGLNQVKKELQEIIDNKIEVGFLTLESAKSYSHKIDLLFAECSNVSIDEVSLLQNARYVLENIINAAGVSSLGPAQHPEHAVLITACYWVDEFLQQAQVEVDLK